VNGEWEISIEEPDCIICGEPLLKGDETNIHEWCEEF